MYFFSFSTDVEEVTFDPNSQWEPVPVKQEPKDEECQGPQPAKKARPSPPDSLPLSGAGTPTSQMSSSSGPCSPYQTQPPLNPGMGVATPPGWTPPEMHGSSEGGQLQEHNLDTSGCTLAATTPSGEWVDIVVQGNASLLATFPSFFAFLRNCLLARYWDFGFISHTLSCYTVIVIVINIVLSNVI